MAAGLQPSKNDIDLIMGSLARDIRLNLRKAADFKAVFLDPRTDQQLIDMGYTQGDVNFIRSAFVDATLLNNIFLGTATQGTLKDFTAFLKALWGAGGSY